MVLAALVAVASLTANAQVWVGGEVGFSAGKTTYDGEKLGAGANFNLIPEIGYTLNDKFDVAIAIGIAHKNFNGEPYAGTANHDLVVTGIVEEFEMGSQNNNRNSLVINPYIRYKFAKTGDFTFFVDGGFSYERIHYSKGFEGANNATQWGLGIKPGIAYNLSDKVGLVAHVGDLSYNFFKMKDLKNNEFNMGLTGNNITFGAYVNF